MQAMMSRMKFVETCHHSWTVFLCYFEVLSVKKPLPVGLCPQKRDSCWHCCQYSTELCLCICNQTCQTTKKELSMYCKLNQKMIANYR